MRISDTTVWIMLLRLLVQFLFYAQTWQTYELLIRALWPSPLTFGPKIWWFCLPFLKFSKASLSSSHTVPSSRQSGRSRKTNIYHLKEANDSGKHLITLMNHFLTICSFINPALIITLTTVRQRQQKAGIWRGLSLAPSILKRFGGGWLMDSRSSGDSFLFFSGKRKKTIFALKKKRSI